MLNESRVSSPAERWRSTRRSRWLSALFGAPVAARRADDGDAQCALPPLELVEGGRARGGGSMEDDERAAGIASTEVADDVGRVALERCPLARADRLERVERDPALFELPACDGASAYERERPEHPSVEHATGVR